MENSTLSEIKNELSINPDMGMYYCGKRINTKNHTYGPEIRSHYLFVLVNKGHGTLHLDKDIPLREHDVLVMCPGERIHYTAETNWSIQWVGLYGDTVKEYLNLLGINGNNPIIQCPLWRELEITLEKIYNLSDDISLPSKLSLSGLVFEFFSLLFKSSNLKEEIDYVNLALKIIDYNFNTPLSIADLAAKLQLNISYFTRLFTNKVGISPKQYILNKKIDRAIELLTSTNASVKEIANSVGIEDQLYFSKIFKKKTGVSPSEFKNSTERRLHE